MTVAARALLQVDRARLDPVLASTTQACFRSGGRDPNSHRRFCCSGLSACRYPAPAAQVVRSTPTVQKLDVLAKLTYINIGVALELFSGFNEFGCLNHEGLIDAGSGHKLHIQLLHYLL